MTRKVSLSMSGDQHIRLRHFLLPEDGKEAVAILLCGRRDGDWRHRLVVRDIHLVPYEECGVRSAAQVTWSPGSIEGVLDRASRENLSVIKMHSHPLGSRAFSAIDDIGDSRLLPMIRGWVEADVLHGSVVMLPGGEMFGRIQHPDGQFEALNSISVVGHDIQFWFSENAGSLETGFAASHAQAFGSGTTNLLQRLTVAVIGASGTGSPTIEMLVRLGVGRIVVVDDDITEIRNINRIYNSTMDHAQAGTAKVHVAEEAIDRIGLGTEVIAINASLWDGNAIRQVAQCDAVFGCMDSIDGRYVLNLLATCYTIPYFDVGIRLDADQVGGVREVCGTVHYLQPGRSSLLSRGMFTMKQVADAGLMRKDPVAFRNQVDAGYIKGVEEHRPAVISVNTFASSLMVSEFLARLHPFREEANNCYASVGFSLASMELFPEVEQEDCATIGPKLGVGDAVPLLGLMELAERAAA